MQGKKVLNNIYWHSSLTSAQSEAVQQHIAEAETLANLKAGIDYNIIKYDSKSQSLSLLWYPKFFEEAFPALEKSYRINLPTQRVEKRNYQTSLNPPILHHKELMLSSNDPHSAHFKELTTTAEKLGLFDNTLRISFKQAWENLLAEKGFQLIDHQFVPMVNFDVQDEPCKSATLARRTLSRSHLSAPMQCLARHGFLDGAYSVFDYGCGKGDDIKNLIANDISATGWDPHYAADQPKQSASIVNLGFVINVIESYQERLEALRGAYALTEQVLVVSAMLINQNAFRGQVSNDDVISKHHTFQKYFTQSELKEFINDSLDTEAIPVAPGIFFIFKDSAAEQRFLLNRQHSQHTALRLAYRSAHPTVPKLLPNEQQYLSAKALIDPLWQQSLELGRLPERSEIENLLELIQHFGTASKALDFMLEQFDESFLEQARQSRINDLLTYFALQTFSKRKLYSHLEDTLQKDIKAFFGDYQNALSSATALLYQISNAELITATCLQASEQGLGYLDDENALHLHTSLVEQLPALLRIYSGCASVLYGDIEQTDLIKIHSQSGKLSLMRYDDFQNLPLPRLLERVKVNLRHQSFDLYEYGEDYEPTYLYLKSRYINEEFYNYAEQLSFDEHLQALDLCHLYGYGPKPEKFREILLKARWDIKDFDLIRSQTIPELDDHCGQNLTYRQLIECGETQHQTGLANCPKQPDSYTALQELARHILDPVIDYFGMIKLSYGFCSHELGKHINKQVAPKLDQHAAHEINSNKNLICPRLGAAIDFIVEDENMREVADWVSENTPFDRLYFYGEDRPIHVSYGPEQKGEYIDLVMTEAGQQVPKKRTQGAA